MTINNNPQGISQANYLNDAKKTSDTALERIAAMRAIDGKDGANLAIADSLMSQYSTVDQGIANSYDAIAVFQIADSSLNRINESADRLSELSVRSNNAALSDNQRAMLNTEAQRVITSINDAFNNTQYNGKNVFQSMEFVVGSGVEQTNLNPINTSELSLDNTDAIQRFSEDVSRLRADIGAGINAIYSNMNASMENSVNLKDAENRLLNNDMAVNVNQLNEGFLKQNSASFMMAHQNNILQTKIASLLN